MQWARLDLSPLSPRFAHAHILTCSFTWQKVQPLSFRWGLFCHSAALRRATVEFTYPICARMLGSMRSSWVARSVPQMAFPHHGLPFPFLPSPLPLSVGPLPLCLQCWGREWGGGVAVPFPPWINSWEPHFLLIKIHKSTAVPMVKKIHVLFLPCSGFLCGLSYYEITSIHCFSYCGLPFINTPLFRTATREERMIKTPQAS